MFGEGGQIFLKLLKFGSDFESIDSDIESTEGQCVAMSLSHKEKNHLEKGIWFSVVVPFFACCPSTFPSHQKLNICFDLICFLVLVELRQSKCKSVSAVLSLARTFHRVIRESGTQISRRLRFATVQAFYKR